MAGLVCRFWEDSPLGRVEDEYGDIAARTAAISILAEAGFLAHGPVQVREIAWTLSSDALLNQYRYIGIVR
ncbi:MAG: hypothetical protein HQ567_24595 [Candidatus Nealsonbacteria bacterium]|nr:hypothetical protein [Candidatus Nealsonbacteria bacterium]